MFRANGYPQNVINNIIKYKIDSLYTQNIGKNSNNVGDKDNTIFCKLPYLGENSIKIRQYHSNERFDDQKKGERRIKTYYNIPKISNLLRINKVKDIMNYYNIVNMFSCVKDNKISYIGKTIRPLGVRINEHKNEKSAVGQHLLDCRECCLEPLVNRFRIICRANSTSELNILEAVHIQKFNPSLNTAFTRNVSDSLIIS